MPYKKIIEIADILNGFAFQSKKYVKSGIRVIRIANVQDGEIVDEQPCFYPNETRNEIEKYMLKEGDLLVSLTGNVGRVGLIPRDMLPAALNQRVCCLRLKKDNVDLKYLFLYLRRKDFVRECIKASKGVAQLNLSTKWLENYEISLPSLSEQKRIVNKIEELFSELDSAVETLKKTKEQLAVYKQVALKKAFEPKKNWRCVKVSEIGEVNLGRQRSPKNVSKDYPTKYIRAANITESGIDLSDILEMEFTPKEREKYYLKKNDILISEASGSANQVGKPAIWKNEVDNCCFQNTVIRHRVINNNPEYVYWYYKNLYVNGFFSRNVGGVGINHLGANNFSNFEIHIPDNLSEQSGIVKQIESQLSICETIEKTVNDALAQAEAMRQSVLKKAFEGGL